MSHLGRESRPVPEMTGDSRLHFGVLGTFRVDQDGREVDLGARLQRTLLAVLVVEAGHVVPVDRLIDLLWRDEPPAAAIASVQAYVSQLRRVLEPGRPPRSPARVLVTKDPGYMLCVGDDQVDALRFQALTRKAHSDLAGGQPAVAATRLEEALALWRGEPLAEFADEPWAVPAVARLTEAHDLAAEDRIGAWLAQGRHAEAAAELESMVQARPLRERRWGQLIVAAYRCGRQADALRAYQRCRTVLAGELGLEPGPELRRLEAAVLAQDPSLDWQPAAAPPAPGQAASHQVRAERPPAVPPAAGPAGEGAGAAPSLVGRDTELAHLRSRLRDAAAGHGGAVVLVGEPGAGKTTLAEAAAQIAVGTGFTSAWGRCLDAASTPAYWPWSQLLRALPDGPAVAAARQRLDGDVEGEGENSVRQFRAYQAVAAALGEAAASAAVLAVVDDLHAADDASLALLQLLAGDLHRMPVLLLFTVRDTEPAPALSQALGELLRHPGAERVGVHPFAPADVAALLERLTKGPPDTDVVTALMDRTGGNPFYTDDMLAGHRADLAPRVQAILRTNSLTERIRFGDFARFDTEFAQAWRLATDVLHSPELQGQLRFVQACRHFFAREVDRGLAVAELGFQELAGVTTTWREPTRFVMDSCLMLIAGTLGDHAEQLAARLAQPDHPSIPHLAAPAAALGFAQRGDGQRARQIASRWFAPPPRSWTWIQAITYWAQVATALGIPDPGWLYDRLAPHGGELAIVGVGLDCGGAVDSLLAGLAWRLGRLDEAAGRARAGLALETRVGSGIWIRRTKDLIGQINATPGALPQDPGDMPGSGSTPS